MAGIAGVVAPTGASSVLSVILRNQHDLGPVINRIELGASTLVAQAQPGELSAASVRQSDDVIFCIHTRHCPAGPIVDQLIERWHRDGVRALPAWRFDFAIAVWDNRSQTLYLARAPLSSFGLAYCRRGATVLFSTLAAALSRDSVPDLDWLAAQHGGGAVFGARRTAFSDVELVEPGTVVCIRHGETEARRFWHARLAPLPPKEAADQLRSALEGAVRDAIAGASGPVAAHLSAGRDSGAIAATAALALKERNESLLALTAVPAADAVLPDGPFCADEGAAASKVAGLHSNMDHRRIATSRFALGAQLDRINRLLPGPHGMPVNLAWWSVLNRCARAEGARLVLAGTAGNLTLSAGGPWAIGDLLRRGDPVGWLNALVAARQLRNSSWKNLLAMTFGASLPSAVYASLLRLSGRQPRRRGYFLRGALRERVAQASRSGDARPPRDWNAMRLAALESWDGADPSNEPVHGVTMRDPAADIRVVEAALAIGPRDLASPYDRRPIFEQAFADRLPLSTLRPRYRGLQAADWPMAIDPRELRSYFETTAGSRSVQELVDVVRVRTALAHWPEGSPARDRAELYADELLPAVSLASFAHIHWPG